MPPLNLDELRSEILRRSPRVTATNVERALAALVDGGAAEHIVSVTPVGSGNFVCFASAAGTRLAWLHESHLDVVDLYAPDYALLSGNYGVSRVPFPGYSEGTTGTTPPTVDLPCQLCFNVHAPSEECF